MPEAHGILSTILATLAAAGSVILVLVSLLILAKRTLEPSGDVWMVINGDEAHPVRATAGTTLLFALADQSVFLPSACGGSGICALCRCQVLAGGGKVLPTETNHLTRHEVNEHWRLACQVKVRHNLRLQIPQEVLGVRKWTCEVLSNRNVASFIKEIVAGLPPGEILDFKPGSYVQIDVPPCKVDYRDIDVNPEFRDEWDKYRMWDLKMVNREQTFRAYSMANPPAEGNLIKLNVRIATPPWDKVAKAWAPVPPGVCSSYLFSRKPSDKIGVSGPFGTFFIKHTDREMVYIGGGAGMAPLRSHIFHLFHTLKTTRKVSYWYGGRSLRELFYTEDFQNIALEFSNFDYHIALSEPLPEDRWEGHTGFIHQVLFDNYLKNHAEPEDVEYYLCGPPPMLRTSLKMLDELGVPPRNIAYDDFGG